MNKIPATKKQESPFYITIQDYSKHTGLPNPSTLRHWVISTISNRFKTASLNIRLVDEAESETLNQQYRHKSGPTNILSFPFEVPPGIPNNILGDVVLCPSLIQKEAEREAKELHQHWAHLIIHGCLHLLGYHHNDPQEAEPMEHLEIRYLAQLGYLNPYE